MAQILLLTPQLPYPPHQGTSLRNFHIICGLAERHQVSLLSYVEAGQSREPALLAPLRQRCRRIEMVPVPTRSGKTRLRQLVTSRLPDMAHRLYSEPFNEALRRMLHANQYQIVQIEGIELAYTAEIIRVASKGSHILYDSHNAETELQRRNFWVDSRQPRRWPAAVYSGLQVGRLRRFERWICEEADAVTAVSAADAVHLQALTSQPLQITTIPNCLDTEPYRRPSARPAPETRFDLIFNGKMDYRPNVDAVLWFARQVWPLILAARPSTTWAVVGQKPHARLAALADRPGVTVTGWVESMLPYLQGCKLVVMPLRIGSGTRLKLIEAMAAGKPIVSTMVGAEGFAVTHGENIVLADRPQQMATAVLRLLADESGRLQLGQQAQQFAIRYDWRTVVPRFEEIYQRMLNTGLASD